ncbi:hypothetical protein EGI31_02070 [Lacihabitans soyangensis]|uniref:Uncharacterized protein n=1 Tax=Lacihabitans soyangensis TaxID=869394 RepID=A0AAE3KRQ3_9BACT|nr:hypothetical protein [Lacihabitans soyangensis]
MNKKMKFKFTVFAILLLNFSFDQKTKEVFNKKPMKYMMYSNLTNRKGMDIIKNMVIAID